MVKHTDTSSGGGEADSDGAILAKANANKR